MTYKHYFLLFLSYSILGWIIEVLGKLINDKRIINRGFLLGPYCPIYGFGCVLITLLLDKYINDPIILFIMSMIICSILEYWTSYIMEKLFKARWWDYSSYKYNINGRVCLNTMIPFGILSCFLMYVLNPFYISILTNMSDKLLNVICIITLIPFTADVIISFNVITKLKLTKLELKDNTEEISKEVREFLKQGSLLASRLLNAFPHIKIPNSSKKK